MTNSRAPALMFGEDADWSNEPDLRRVNCVRLQMTESETGCDGVEVTRVQTLIVVHSTDERVRHEKKQERRCG